MQNSLDPDLAAVLQYGCQENFAAYIKYMMPEYQMAPHLTKLIKLLEKVERGEIKRLMVFMPPRHGKSQTVSRLFPSWFMGKHPDREVIFATYAQDFADDFGRQVRGFIGSEPYQHVFPDVQLSMDSRARARFNLDNNSGSYFAVGRGGPITGRGGHLIVIDDPIKNREEAQSDLIRENLYQWYQSTLYTRLAPGGVLVLVQTRWHEDDLAGRIIENDPDEWAIIEFPAISDDNVPLWQDRDWETTLHPEPDGYIT